MDMHDELISLDELCELLKVRKSYIYKLTSRNIIPFYRIGGLKFKLNEVEAWIEQKQDQSGTTEDYRTTLERDLKCAIFVPK